ncbi:hypothetical protein BCEN4_350080 [Burkholderia cenocepacia]|nr:hypothetical protein BCEN4_350080 [Burkholderia cenocepacia]
MCVVAVPPTVLGGEAAGDRLAVAGRKQPAIPSPKLTAKRLLHSEIRR